MIPKKEPEPELAEVIEDIRAQAWNVSIAPRVPALISLLSTDEWKNGIQAWMLSMEKELDRKLRFGCKTRDDDQFVRGKLSILVELIDLPRILDQHQKMKEERKKMEASRGKAGY
jgi:hypothetical protein